MTRSAEAAIREEVNILTGSVVSALANPETAQELASFARNYYDALVAKQFSKDDALRIVVTHGFPRLLPTAR